MDDLTSLVLDDEFQLVWEVLLEGRHFIDKDEDGWTPLHAAAVRGSSFLIDPLLAAGGSLASFNHMGWTPVHIAAAQNETRFLKRTLQPSLTCIRSNNEYESTPLHLAVTYGCVEAVRVLLDAGVDPNIRDFHGLTAMHYAVSYQDQPGMITTLAEYGTLVDDLHEELGTPLHGAIEQRHYGSAVTLIELGANTARMTTDGMSFDGLVSAVGWSGVL